jgi:hypothetical protein
MSDAASPRWYTTGSCTPSCQALPKRMSPVVTLLYFHKGFRRDTYGRRMILHYGRFLSMTWCKSCQGLYLYQSSSGTGRLDGRRHFGKRVRYASHLSRMGCQYRIVCPVARDYDFRPVHYYHNGRKLAGFCWTFKFNSSKNRPIINPLAQGRAGI